MALNWYHARFFFLSIFALVKNIKINNLVIIFYVFFSCIWISKLWIYPRTSLYTTVVSIDTNIGYSKQVDSTNKVKSIQKNIIFPVLFWDQITTWLTHVVHNSFTFWLNVLIKICRQNSDQRTWTMTLSIYL